MSIARDSLRLPVLFQNAACAIMMVSLAALGLCLHLDDIFPRMEIFGGFWEADLQSFIQKFAI